jgi:isoleucyl-tRNA synthetase
MLAQVTPFLAESIYQHMLRNSEPTNPETVHLLNWPIYDDKWIDDELETEMNVAQSIISTVALARSEKSLKQRQPVRQIIVATDSKTTRRALRRYATLLSEQANSRSIKVTSRSQGAKLAEENNAARFATAQFTDGTIHVDLKLTRNDLAEGLARDVVRRIQQMRKEMDLKVDAYVEAYIVTSQSGMKLLRSKRNYVAKEIRAKKLTLSTEKTVSDNDYYSKMWPIGNEKYTLGLREISKKIQRI